MWYILKIYYDSSKGPIDIGDGLLSDMFTISFGVKQGGILSPFLFHAYIDELIYYCTDANIGAIFNKVNVSIIVYADDIILLSSIDSHLQKLLNICNNYSKIWRLNFNSNKSNIVEFGKQFFKNSKFYLNDKIIPKTDKITYLGVIIDNKLDFNANTIEKFSNVQKAIYSLSFLGLRPNSISPHLQSFIYKTYCLSQFTYGLETTVLNKETRDYLNISQNNILRQVLGVHKYCHMSRILKCLKVFNIEDLYIYSKLSFLNSIQQNIITSFIFNELCSSKRNRLSKSFIQDIKVLENRFRSKIVDICLELKTYRKLLKSNFYLKDGITDSVNICLIKFKSKSFKNILDNLIKPDFIRQDEEFQELLQYLIITDNYS